MFIDGEHAVGIAIEGRAQVGVDFTHLLLQVSHVLRLNGAGRVVGEIAVKLKIERDEFAGQMLEDTRHNHTGHAIAGVNDDFERPNLAHIDERKRVLDISIGHVALDDLAFGGRFGEIAADGEVADIGQAAFPG